MKLIFKYLKLNLLYLVLFMFCLNYAYILKAQQSNNDSKNGIVLIANNLGVKINGVYPNGYKPKWKYINGYAPLEFEFENYVNTRQLTKTQFATIGIFELNGKAIFKFNNCYGELEMDKDFTLINSETKTFKISSFKKIHGQQFTDLNCSSGSNLYTAGGMQGFISFSANENGDLELGINIETFRLASRFKEAGISYRHKINSLLLTNEFTASQAIEYQRTLSNKRKEDSLQNILTIKRRNQELEIFEKEIKNSYSKVANIQSIYNYTPNCLKVHKGENEEKYTYYTEVSTTVMTGGFQSNGTPNYEIQTKQIPNTGYRVVSYEGQKNICNKTIYIKGIKKLKSERGTIYFEDATIKLNFGEMTDSILTLEQNYNPITAEVGSTHYYVNKLVIKQ